MAVEPTKDTSEQERLIAGLGNLVNGDARVRAAWLGGSFGRGDADGFSDVDLYLLLASDEDVAAAAGNLGEFLLPVVMLAYQKRVFGQLYHVVTDQGMRIDVGLAAGETFEVDRGGVRVLKGAERLTDAPPHGFDAARTMGFDVTEFWRVVLLLPAALGRGELLRAWQGGIGFQVTTLINLLTRARGNPQALGAKKLNVQMRAEDRARLEGLLALPIFDGAGIARVTLGLAALMRDVGPRCCATLGEAYPDEWEAVVLGRVRRELPGLGFADLLGETLGG